jgi:hypothetical protein
MTGYPRDLVGYADQLPDPRWPGRVRLALNFVVNFLAAHARLRRA